MLIEKDSIKCEAVFNEDRTHRYLWKRVWSKDKPLATVIMLNPCSADNIITDTTTALVVNNIARLERFGGVNIVNLYSMLTPKLCFRWNSDAMLNDPNNDDYIRKAADESAAVILAWGKAADTNQRIADRAAQVLGRLKGCREKMFLISDGVRNGLHPLTPSVRAAWQLQAFSLETWQARREQEEREKREREASHNAATPQESAS